MTAEDINRVPVGVAGAGRFAPNPPKAESPVKLFDRGDGSYLHPSPSSTADHCIDFWSNVNIPDEIITQVESAYYNDRVSEINEDLELSTEDWSHTWVDANPPPANPGDVEAYNESFRRDREAYQSSILPELKARRPLLIGEYDARQLIRSYQMQSTRPQPKKFPEESNRVLLHEVELYDETLTVREIELKYRLSRIKGFITKLRGDGSQDAVRAAQLETALEAQLEAAEETNSYLKSISKTLVYQQLEARDHAAQ